MGIVVTEAAQFLAVMAPGAPVFFQTFDEHKDRPTGLRPLTLFGSYEQHEADLIRANRAGQGVFWAVNPVSGGVRSKATTAAIRYVYGDWDTSDPTLLNQAVQRLTPRAIVESSPGKYHAYWPVADCPVGPPEADGPAEAAMRALVRRYGCDKAAVDRSRVLRLPGFIHAKAEPVAVRVVYLEAAVQPYPFAYLQQALDLDLAPATAADGTPPAEWTDTEVAGWRNTLTDEKMQERLNSPAARANAAEAFGGKWTLHQLWAPDLHDLRARGEISEARMALISKVMFLAGGNCARVFDLLHEHPLGIKDDREGLLRTEILKAAKLFGVWWARESARREEQVAEARVIGAQIDESILPTVMTLDEMCEHLVYIERGRYVVDRRGRKTLKWDDAAGTYAASKHHYKDEQGKDQSLPSLTAWRSEPTRRKTAGLVVWRPDAGEFCAPVRPLDGHRVAYNTWRGLKQFDVPANWREWSAWFEHHVAYLVPVATERHRFMQWLAHMVQRPGELPHTCYLMVTETTGTGRNWLAGCLARVIQGYVAPCVQIGPILDGKFNGALSETLLATVDEVREGSGATFYSRGEALKQLVTQEFREINHKYGAQSLEVNCCRWLFMSNHNDALPFDNNDRRVIVIANPTERQSPEYYASLYTLVRTPEFIASVFEFLRTYSLAEFNAGEPAPMNDAKRAVLAAMTPGLDRAVADFKARWPGNFAAASDIRRAIQEDTGETPKDSALQHALRRVGVVQTGRRITIGAVKERIAAWGISPELMAAASNEFITAQIMAGRKTE